MASQKIVIPKGLVNPNETTVIEIPQNLQHVPAVVAVRRGDDPGGTYSGDGLGAQHSEYGDYSNMTIPEFPSYPLIPDVKGETITEIKPRRDLMDFSDKAASIGGQGLEASIRRQSLDDSSGMSQAKFEDCVQKNTSWRLETSENEIRGPREEVIHYSDPDLRKGSFDPYGHTYQTMKFASPYKQFQPSQWSTPTSYVPSGESATDWRNMSKPEEKSYLKTRSAMGPVEGQRLKTIPYEIDNTEMSSIKDVLEKMEYIELSRIQQDLRDFQVARRKLIFDATNMAPPKLGVCRSSKIPRYAKSYKR